MSQTLTKIVIILSGIPNSGKSTYVNHVLKVFDKTNIRVISRDQLREELYGKNYRHNTNNEKEISRLADIELDDYLSDDSIEWIIIDNTHCKGAYIDDIKSKVGNRAIVTVTHFPVNLLRAKIRNIARWWFTGKYIPMSVMNNMYKNYTKLVKSGKYNF